MTTTYVTFYFINVLLSLEPSHEHFLCKIIMNPSKKNKIIPKKERLKMQMWEKAIIKDEIRKDLDLLEIFISMT